MTEEISYPVINKEICKGCMRCIVGCPQCTGCKDCYFTCPEPLALEVHQIKNIVNDSVAKMIKAKVANQGGE